MYTHTNGISFKKMGLEHLTKMKELKDETYQDTHHLTIVNNEDQWQWYDNLQKDKSKLFLVASVVWEIGQSCEWREVGVFKLDSIDWINSSCNVGWDIFKGYRGRGLGKKLIVAGSDFCFNVLNLHRINAEILSTNAISIKCAEYAGFQLEGTRRLAVYKFGSYIDSHCYAKVKD